MNTQRLNDWVQTVTGIAIVIGLVLVIWELQQSREATQSQLTSDYFQMSSQIKATVMGEHTAMVLAKACDKPSELSREELHVLDQYYLEAINRLDRLQALQDRGTFYSDYDLEDFATATLGPLLQSAAGRAYLKTAPLRRFRAIIDKHLEEWNGPDCAVFFDSWQGNIKKELK